MSTAVHTRGPAAGLDAVPTGWGPSAVTIGVRGRLLSQLHPVLLGRQRSAVYCGLGAVVPPAAAHRACSSGKVRSGASLPPPYRDRLRPGLDDLPRSRTAAPLGARR